MHRQWYREQLRTGRSAPQAPAETPDLPGGGGAALQVKTMHRIDEQLIQLDKELQTATNKEGANGPAAGAASAKVKARENELLPIYTQLATRFAPH